MSDYNSAVSKINGKPEVQARSEASEARGAHLVYKGTIQPPLDLQLVDESTGECVTIENDVKKQSLADRLTLRYKRQTESRKALYGFHEQTKYKANGHVKHHETCYCQYVPYTKDVDVLRHPVTERFNLSGLATCGSAAVCPVCESIISERRANELRAAFKQAQALDLHIQLLTFTIPHQFGDDIGDLRPKLSLAQQQFFNGSPWKKCKEKYGIVAYCRSLECRYGANGWHPHFHFIVFSEKPLPKTKLLKQNATAKRWRKLDINQQSQDWLWFLNRWGNMCEKVGLSRPNEYGMDIRDGSMAYDYICKYGMDGERLKTDGRVKKELTWDMADEVTKGNKKDGKSSFSPFQLLDVLGDRNTSKTEKQNARIQFLKYARAMKGVPLLRWSKSAFDIFCFDDVTDTELLKANDDESSLIAQITVFEWRCILKHSSRDLFMSVVNSDVGADGIKAYVSSVVDLEKSSLSDSFFDGSRLPVDDCPIDAESIITCDISVREQFDTNSGFAEYAKSSESSDGVFVPLDQDEITRALVSKSAPFPHVKLPVLNNSGFDGLDLSGYKSNADRIKFQKMVNAPVRSGQLPLVYSVDDWNRDLTFQAAFELDFDEVDHVDD